MPARQSRARWSTRARRHTFDLRLPRIAARACTRRTLCPRVRRARESPSHTHATHTLGSWRAGPRRWHYGCIRHSVRQLPAPERPARPPLIASSPPLRARIACGAPTGCASNRPCHIVLLLLGITISLWHAQRTFIMIKPDGVQRGLVRAPSSRSLCAPRLARAPDARCTGHARTRADARCSRLRGRRMACTHRSARSSSASRSAASSWSRSS